MKAFVTSILCVFTLLVSSCKKDREPQPEKSLIGDWRETELNGFTRSVKFTQDRSFFLSIGHDDGNGIMYAGEYRIKGDSLIVSTKEMLVQEPGKVGQRTATTYPLYEKATFNVNGDTLTLKYITYPADGPVPTTAKFRRMITID